jgi:hypothetical protein
MLKKLAPLVVVFFIGCATQSVPLPPPTKSAPCDGVYVPGKGCQALGAGSYGGAVRGHHEQND